MATLLGRNWWVLLLRGIAAIIFSLLAWFQPAITLAALIMLFGIYTLADGILTTWMAIAGRKSNDHWWLLLLSGLLSIAVGILTFMMPDLTALVLLVYIAVWAIVTGIMQIVVAIRIRKEVTGEWLLALGGIISVVFGFFLIAQPAAGALSLLWVIAGYVFVIGILMVIFSFKIRRFAHPN